MNTFKSNLLKSLRKVYSLIFGSEEIVKYSKLDADETSDYLYDLIRSDHACMIARFGSTELLCIMNYLGVSEKNPSTWKYITGRQQQWWWDTNKMELMQSCSGFFPITEEKLTDFCEMMLRDSKLVDVLGCWRPDEQHLDNYLRDAKRVRLMYLEPYWGKDPWSRALEGKRVVVVHPFKEDIESQYYNNRERLFKDQRVLPQFASLRVIKAVQSLGGEDNGFNDWFEALEWMKKEMDKEEYDVALIGCGAYGFPLAAHSKRTGHKAIHLGGALQLLFGIRGKRWEDPNYGVKQWNLPVGKYSNLMNEYWIRPMESNKPKSADNVEGACYW